MQPTHDKKYCVVRIQTNMADLGPVTEPLQMSRDMWFPTMWHFDKCRLKRACAVSF